MNSLTVLNLSEKAKPCQSRPSDGVGLWGHVVGNRRELTYEYVLMLIPVSIFGF